MGFLGWVLAVVLVLSGIAGTVLPVLPGAPLVFLGLLTAAWVDGFHRVGGITLAILALLTAMSFFADLFALAVGVKRANASRQALVGAMIGTIGGLFLGLPGLILGPFIGAAAGELIAHPDLRRAGQVGLATWIGLVLGTAVKLALVFVMVGIFILSYLWK